VQTIPVQFGPGTPLSVEQWAGDINETQPRRRFAIGAQLPVGFLLPFQPGGEVGRRFDSQEQDGQGRIALTQAFDQLPEPVHHQPRPGPPGTEIIFARIDHDDPWPVGKNHPVGIMQHIAQVRATKAPI